MKKRDQYPVQVWNDHSFPWEETFKGEKVTIPAMGFKLMEFYEGHEFKSQFYTLTKNADETENERTQKRIRVVEAAYKEAMEGPDEDDDTAQEVFMCNAKNCKKAFTTETALLKHSIKEHDEEMVVDQDAEREMPKRKPGRPKATATV